MTSADAASAGLESAGRGWGIGDQPGREPLSAGSGKTSETPTTSGHSPRPATIRDVATLAGVSHQTVSRFLKGYQGIRPATRDRVAQALEALDYRPNLTARALTTGRSNRIGALVQELSQFGPSQIVQGAAEAAGEAGLLLDIVPINMGDLNEVTRALAMLREHDLAGIVALASTDHMAEALTAANFRVPALLAGEADEPPRHSSELAGGGFTDLIDHLATLGHRRLLHIGGPSTWSAARNRARAFQLALEDRGLESVGITHGDWSARSGYDAIMALPHSLHFTAVVSANDQMALGAIHALGSRGLRVPEDISVTGVDDVPDAPFYSPSLTTLHVDFIAQGRRAVDTLLARIDGNEPSPLSTAASSHLVIRSSTGEVARAHHWPQ